MGTVENSDGVAGESAKQQYIKKVKTIEDKRISRLGPTFGKLANLYFGDSRSTEAWSKGAVGEFYVGKVLDDMCQQYGFKVLHDRKIPKSVANNDHILISSRGIFVIDAKNYKGMVRVEEKGGIFSPLTETLYVGNRNQTKLVEGVKKQIAIVTKAFDDHNSSVPIFGMLAFYKAEWPLFFKPKEVDGILINSKGVEAAVMNKVAGVNVDVQAQFDFLKEAFPAK